MIMLKLSPGDRVPQFKNRWYTPQRRIFREPFANGSRDVRLASVCTRLNISCARSKPSGILHVQSCYYSREISHAIIITAVFQKTRFVIVFSMNRHGDVAWDLLVGRLRRRRYPVRGYIIERVSER